MIKPTVGRVVWFAPSTVHPVPDFLTIDPSQPCAAMVVYVWNDRLVNLTVSDHYGKTFNMTSVQLLQDGDDFIRPVHGYFCSWMPYQVGQAAKHAGEATGAAPMSRTRDGKPVSNGPPNKPGASAGYALNGLSETDPIPSTI